MDFFITQREMKMGLFSKRENFTYSSFNKGFRLEMYLENNLK